MSTSFFLDTIFEIGRMSLLYDSVLYCYAQEWTLTEYSVSDARLKQSILSIDVDDIPLHNNFVHLSKTH